MRLRRPPRFAAPLGVLAAGLVAAAGCSPAKVATNPPPHHTGAPVVDLSAPPQGFLALDRATADTLTQVTALRPPAPVATRPLNVLAVSGGGQFGSYAAGLLAGWTCRGDRPEFDVVTGISSGALIAAFAYLGPKYDPQLTRLFTTLEAEDLFSGRRVVRNIRQYRALQSAEPIKDMIAETVDDEFVADLRAAHASGRRLFVGTMVINVRRPVYWDLGAIASQPCGQQRVRDILLATASIPGFVPAVPLHVEVNGQCHEELHGDAGGVAQVFVRFGEHHPRPDPAHPAAPWLAESNLYIIGGGKLYPEILEPELGVLARLSSTVSGTLFALFRSDVWRLFTLCRVSGMGFHLAVVPEDVPSSPSSMEFDPDLQRALYTVAYDQVMQGATWRCTPPGYEPGEEDHPRTGFRLAVPHPKPAPGPFVPPNRRGLGRLY